MLLSVKDIEKGYGTETLFSGISFNIDEGHKVALVGRNGIGKSTIMKIIAGLEDSDSGTIKLTSGKKVAYLPQEIVKGDERTGIEYIQNELDVLPHQFIPILQGLGVTEEVANQKLNTMSGGQQTKILLTRFLLEPSDILLLDEPTNNLDIPSLLWLEVFLAESKKAMIIISHDLVFLDNVANRVFELKDKKLSVERGTYSDYLERRKKDLERQGREYKIYMEKVAQIEGNISSLQNRTAEIDKVESSDNDKMEADRKAGAAQKGQSKIKTMKTKLRQMDKIEKPFEEDPFVLKISPKNLENVSIHSENLFAGYEHLRVGPINISLKAGTRICIMGQNGAGKSTILKTLIGNIPALEGDLDISEGVVFGDLLQQHDRADRSMKAIDFFIQQTNSDYEKGIHTLKLTGFQDSNIEQSIEGLSSGMRARLLFAVFMASNVNVLILDEPTNHLDIEGVSALKDLLKTYEGAVIVVSHNRWFLEDLSIESYYNVIEGKFETIKDFELYIKDAQKQAEILVQRIKRISQKINS